MTRDDYIADILLEAADLLRYDSSNKNNNYIVLQETIGSKLIEIGKVIIEKIIHVCRHIKAYFLSKVKGDIEPPNSDSILDINATLEVFRKIQHNLDDPSELNELEYKLFIDSSSKKINRNKLVTLINISETLTRKIDKCMNNSKSENIGGYVKALKYIQKISNYVLHLQGKISENELADIEKKESGNKKEEKQKMLSDKKKEDNEKEKDNNTPFKLRRQSPLYADGHITMNDEIADIIDELDDMDKFSPGCVTKLHELCKVAGIDVNFASIYVLPRRIEIGGKTAKDIPLNGKDLFIKMYKKKEVTIPAGTELYHVSPVKLNTLKPSYKSPTSYIAYTSGRIYFSKNKPMNVGGISIEYSKNDLYVYKYIPKTNIKAFVDTEYLDFNNVFIENKSIPVELVEVKKR